jgi:hypothetical protein
VTPAAPKPAKARVSEDDLEMERKDEPRSDLASARLIGEIEAELVHLRYRLKESVARELRLVERTLRAEELLDQALSTEHELREQVARYAAFHDAVQRSRPWRLIQFFRKLVGRGW